MISIMRRASDRAVRILHRPPISLREQEPSLQNKSRLISIFRTKLWKDDSALHAACMCWWMTHGLRFHFFPGTGSVHVIDEK